MAVPEIPEAAYRASIPPPGTLPGSTIGVSGGGGEPRLALVVEFEAVDANRFTPWSPILDCSPLGGCKEDVALLAELEVDAAPGGG